MMIKIRETSVLYVQSAHPSGAHVYLSVAPSRLTEGRRVVEDALRMKGVGSSPLLPRCPPAGPHPSSGAFQKEKLLT